MHRLENTDYDKAAGDPNMAWLASQGITLSNYYGVTHPSEPNYVASVGGKIRQTREIMLHANYASNR